jgi:hypothetical protein
MPRDYLSAFVEKFKETPPELEPVELPNNPEHLAGYRRGIKVTDAPEPRSAPFVSVEEARELIWEEMQIRELFGAPQDVDVFLWREVVAFVRVVEREHGHVTATHLVDGLNLNKRSASMYLYALLATGEWEPAIGTKRRQTMAHAQSAGQADR